MTNEKATDWVSWTYLASSSALATIEMSLLTTFADLQHHLFLLCLGGKLGLSPPNEETSKVKRVLDVGTGTGIWAIEFGDLHPEAEVGLIHPFCAAWIHLLTTTLGSRNGPVASAGTVCSPTPELAELFLTPTGRPRM